MKFSDQFLESYAALFGKESADSFLMHNLDKYVPAANSDPATNAENENPETPDQEKKPDMPETAVSEADCKEDKG